MELVIGVLGIILMWVVCGLLLTAILLHEDREQVRERIAREQGSYPPVRTLKSLDHTHLHLPEDNQP